MRSTGRPPCEPERDHRNERTQGRDHAGEPPGEGKGRTGKHHQSESERSETLRQRGADEQIGRPS